MQNQGNSCLIIYKLSGKICGVCFEKGWGRWVGGWGSLPKTSLGYFTRNIRRVPIGSDHVNQ